ncbi:polysaccharide biosynthesis C-terminal domain-containing protein [Roseivirga sp.]|uniref:MATE family efflux transporter n=1 Tax=Roseivirga sp. TaxID=1964215 RepID=UPI003B520F84
MKKLSNNLSQTLYSFAGQISFLLSNFILFLYLARNYDQEVFGHWAIFITTVSILDGIRQGFVQNGLSRLIIRYPDQPEIRSTALLLNYSIVLATSLFLMGLAQFSGSVISGLYLLGYKVLIVLATLQYLNSVYQANRQFKKYFISNLLYLISFSLALALFLTWAGQPELNQLINLMFISIVPSFIYALTQGQIKLMRPARATLSELFHFGKYSSGTNLLSLLFQRVDLLMISYFLDPTAVAIFHFANKIINYTELPLQALSQVIYPRIAASYLQNEGTQLNKTYGNSILWLLAFIIPMSMAVIIFNKTIIYLMGSEEYLAASTIIILLSVATLFKPWGRVFGLTLDAIGKPKMNFYMLAFSLVVNVLFNWMLIPSFGINGAALATSTSIILTIIIGQLNIKRTLAFNPVQEVMSSFKNVYQLNIAKKWN